MEIDLDPSLLCGDLVRVFDLKFLCDTIEFGSMGGEEGQRLKVNLQIAQDVTP